ncbi:MULTISPECIES: ABC transporter permease [unclassified Microbacterium]|uniref:ABC transporter permease n=1 Tax=unclassified Microbacterium TaxID=2609290 RepID=UPI000ACEE588|nr:MULTISPECIES: ABC transporter permease [unclassified Microbacterium]
MTTIPRTTAIPLAAKRRRAERGLTEIIAGAVVLLLFVIMSFLAPVLIGYGPNELGGPPLAPPSPEHPFGTDVLGRDVFVRTFVAVHVDYLVALVGAFVSLAIGTLLGTLAGMARRRTWGTVLMRVTDALIAVPFPLLILLILLTVGNQVSVLGTPPGVFQILVGIVVVGWSIYARLARAEAAGLRSRDYIVAAELMGYGKGRITFRHIMPAVIAVTGTYAVADAVIIVGFVASLPFLGAGVPPPTPEWGSMMYEGRSSIVFAWWQVIFPALALTISAVAASVIADGLLDRTSRKLRRQE